jgi:hypothetical protein
LDIVRGCISGSPECDHAVVDELVDGTTVAMDGLEDLALVASQVVGLFLRLHLGTDLQAAPNGWAFLPAARHRASRRSIDQRATAATSLTQIDPAI